MNNKFLKEAILARVSNMLKSAHSNDEHEQKISLAENAYLDGKFELADRLLEELGF